MPRQSGHNARGYKGNRIVRDLREAIVSNRLKVRQRLPSNIELCSHYGVTPVTVGRAIRRLAEDGFVVARERSGVFVAERPPHHVCFALAFPLHPAHDENAAGWTRFWNVLLHEASCKTVDPDIVFKIYYDVRPGMEQGDAKRLQDDVLARRLAGIIFASNPGAMAGPSLLTACNIPRIALTNRVETDNIHCVGLENFGDRVLDFFAAQHCKRIARIVSSRLAFEGDAASAVFSAGVQARGMQTCAEWQQYADIGSPSSAINLVRLLFSKDAALRPDALFVADDNLIEAVETGLLFANLRVPEDVTVLAHCNFPPPSLLRLPIRCLGYDIRDVLDTAVRLIRRENEGLPSARITLITPLLDTEYEQRQNHNTVPDNNKRDSAV